MSTNDRYLLLLGGAYTQQGMRCIQQAQTRGLRVWLTDTQDKLDQAPEVVAIADRVSTLPYQDPLACSAWAMKQAQSTNFVGVFSFREYAMEAVATVAHTLGLAGNSPDAVRRVRNKFACRAALKAQGFRQPAIALCTSLEDAYQFANTYPPGPWIMKPTSAMGSQGVSLVQDAAGWEQAIKHVGENSAAFIVECFQTGDEFSAEGLFIYGQPHVLALTSKLTTGAPHFVERGHTMPAKLDAATTKRIAQNISLALRTLELNWGLFHVELWLADGEPILGEVHVRAGGDYIHLMIEYVTGIEIYGAVFDQLLGHPLNPFIWQPRRGAAIRYLTPPPGRVIDIQGWDKAISDPKCLSAELKLHVGDLVGPVYSSSDRPGYILVIDETSQSAAQHAERLCTVVEIQVLDVS